MLKSTISALQSTLPSASRAPSELRAGDVLAERYVLVRPLRSGAMGQVWVARNTSTGAEVAAKVLLPERMAAHDALERFRREAHATAQLSHRGIVRAFDLVELDPSKGALLIIMELLRGQTLAERIAASGKLTVAETIQVMLPLLSALDHAHAEGIVHRDLKPENVFLVSEPDGEVLPKLVDFGISKLKNAAMSITAQGALVGTPCYMAPEQARTEDVDARTDIFAAGILLYECLSGTSPFPGNTLHEVVRAVLESEPLPLDNVPPALWDVIDRALAKRPDDRYATARALADALVAAVPGPYAPLRSLGAPPSGPTSLTSVPPTVSPTVAPTTSSQAPKPARKSRVTAALIAACAVVVGVAASERATRGPTMLASQALRAERPAKTLLVARDGLTASSLADDALPAASAPAPTPAPAHRHRDASAARVTPAHVDAPATEAAASDSAPATPIVAPAPAAPPPPPAATVVRDPGF